MADVLAAAHAQILRAIRDAKADVAALRKATKVQTGYMGFELVERNLAEFHAALSGERDQARVVTMLRNAVGAVALLGGGDVAPVVERTRAKFGAILKELEAKDSKNG
jgi:hypothetical protein